MGALAGVWLAGWILPVAVGPVMGAGPAEVLAPAVEASVESGATVSVELRALFTERPGLLGGATARETDFVLVGQPRYGVIVEVRQLPRTGDRDGAAVVYRHLAEAGGLIDEARFEVRDARDGRSMAQLRLTIRILRGILKVEPPGRLWLGDCTVGDTAEGVVTIENAGGAAVSFQVAAWRPFYVEDAGRQIYLAPGARVPVRYQFHPDVPGFYETPLILKPDLVRDYTIEAKAVEALAPSTNRVDFGRVRVGETVRRALRVQNRGRSARQAEVQVSGAFATDAPSVRIPPQGEAEVHIGFRPTAPGEASGWVVLREGANVMRCQLVGSAEIGPDLWIVPGPSVDMGTVTGMVAGFGTRLTVSNRGDVVWEGEVIGSGEFRPELASLRVTPRGMVSMEVRYRPGAFGAHTGEVVFAGPTTAGVMFAAHNVMPSAARPAGVTQVVAEGIAPSPEGRPMAGPAAGAESPPGVAAAPGEGRRAEAASPACDLDPLPVFEPPNFRAGLTGDGTVLVEWDASAELPVEHLYLWERRFRPLAGGGAGIVWTRRPELPQPTPDGRGAFVVLKGLEGGWRLEFALAESGADGEEPKRRTPIIEVATGARREEWRVPWGWIAVAACAIFAALHFFSARSRR